MPMKYTPQEDRSPRFLMRDVDIADQCPLCEIGDQSYTREESHRREGKIPIVAPLHTCNRSGHSMTSASSSPAGMQRAASQSKPNRISHGSHRSSEHGQGCRLGCYDFPPFRRDRGFFHCGPGCRTEHRPNQDGCSVPLGTAR